MLLVLFVDPHLASEPGLAAFVREQASTGRFRQGLRLPPLDVVCDRLGPIRRCELSAAYAACLRSPEHRVLASRTFDELRPEIERRLLRVAQAGSETVDPEGIAAGVLTADSAWASSLRRDFPRVAVLTLDGARSLEWDVPSAHGRRPRFEPSHGLRVLDDGAALARAPAVGLDLGGSLRGAQLGRLLGEGGEGWVFEVLGAGAEPLVCKVFRKPSAWRRAKLERMLAVEPRAGVAWPRALAFDSRDQWLGFVLPRLDGTDLARVLRRVLASPTQPRVEMVELARHALARVASVHDSGALVGDLHPRNLLVSGGTVALLDADSFQLEGFPCPVGNVEYLHPDLLGLDLRGVLRSAVHERFAVATLVFQCLMGGQSPYAHVGGGSQVENQQKHYFPYALGRKSLAQVPLLAAGPFARMWKHLSAELQAAFVQSFEALAPPLLPEWERLLAAYAAALRAGQYSPDNVPASARAPARASARAPAQAPARPAPRARAHP